MNRVCFFHRKDLDGWCSAEIVRYRFPDVKLIGWDYTDPIPWDKINTADEVILVDLTFKPDDMRELAQLAKKPVIWIDHHEKNFERIDRSQFDGIQTGMWDAEKVAGCDLTWKYYFPDETKPSVVWAIGRYDTWAWKEFDDVQLRDQIELIIMALYARDLYPKDEPERDWMLIFERDSQTYYSTLIAEGTVLKRAKDREDRIKVSLTFETAIEFNDRLVPVRAINSFVMGTFLDHVKAKYPECHIVASFQFNGRQWNVSLRGDGNYDGDYNLCDIAKSFGGGGHPNAAGFFGGYDIVEQFFAHNKNTIIQPYTIHQFGDIQQKIRTFFQREYNIVNEYDRFRTSSIAEEIYPNMYKLKSVDKGRYKKQIESVQGALERLCKRGYIQKTQMYTGTLLWKATPIFIKA